MIENLIPRSHFIALSKIKVRPDNEKHLEDITEIKNLLSLICESTPKVMGNLVKVERTDQSDQNFGIFSPVNL